MNLQLSFSEITEFVNREVKAIDIALSQVNEQTLRVSLSKKIILAPIHIADVDLSVDKIDGNDVYLTIAGGAAVESIVKGAATLLQDKLPIWVKQVSDTTFCVQLDKIEKAQKTLLYLSLREVNVLSDGLQAVVAVK